MLKEEKVYVSRDKELRVEIIQSHYDMLVAGHGGKWKMTELVIWNYWWPEVIRDVRRYVEGYDMCERMKNQTEIPAGKLKLSEVLENYRHI